MGQGRAGVTFFSVSLKLHFLSSEVGCMYSILQVNTWQMFWHEKKLCTLISKLCVCVCVCVGGGGGGGYMPPPPWICDHVGIGVDFEVNFDLISTIWCLLLFFYRVVPMWKYLAPKGRSPCLNGNCLDRHRFTRWSALLIPLVPLAWNWFWYYCWCCGIVAAMVKIWDLGLMGLKSLQHCWNLK